MSSFISLDSIDKPENVIQCSIQKPVEKVDSEVFVLLSRKVVVSLYCLI